MAVDQDVYYARQSKFIFESKTWISSIVEFFWYLSFIFMSNTLRIGFSLIEYINKVLRELFMFRTIFRSVVNDMNALQNDMKRFQAHFSLIRGNFDHTSVWSEIILSPL